MKAPKLRGPFRNVRTEPRTFVFRSRHLPELRPEWEARKKRVEAEVLGDVDGPRPIRFRQGGKDVGTRAARRATAIRASRVAAFRAAAIAAVLVYLTYRALVWVEAANVGGWLHWMKTQG
jgi:hypothetical protein